MTYMDEYRAAYGGEWAEPDPEWPLTERPDPLRDLLRAKQAVMDAGAVRYSEERLEKSTEKVDNAGPGPVDYLVCEECGSSDLFEAATTPFCTQCGSTRLSWHDDLTHKPIVDYRDGQTP